MTQEEKDVERMRDSGYVTADGKTAYVGMSFSDRGKLYRIVGINLLGNKDKMVEVLQRGMSCSEMVPVSEINKIRAEKEAPKSSEPDSLSTDSVKSLLKYLEDETN